MKHRPPLWELVRDVAIAMVAFFMLVYETVSPSENELIVGAIVGAAITLLGIPVAKRLDEARRNGKKRRDDR